LNLPRGIRTFSGIRRRRQNGRPWLLLHAGTILILSASLLASCVRSQQPPSEYQVKAAFLFNFAKFVEWPQSSYMGGAAPFSICILGEDPFGDALNNLRGKFVANRPLAIWRIKNPEAGWRCQMLFVSASEKSHLPAIFAALHGANALLVGETDGFAAKGGAIQFTLEENHVRFVINPDAIRRAGLQISSKLLALATIVHDDRSAGKG
jgi:YfiR/HmsC-like